MKKSNWLVLFIISALLLILNGCFSPYGADETNITISLGDLGRVAVSSAEINTLSYEVILDGPGGRRTESFSGTSTSIRVRPGTYNVMVRAIGNNPGGAYLTDFPARMLRGWGSTRVSIRPGGDNNVSIAMATATEVTTSAQITAALGQSAAMGSREHIIVIKGTVAAPASNSVSGRVTLVAEDASTINMSNASFSVPNPVTNRLTLGKEGMGGTLTLDGRGAHNEALINVSGTLEMNDGVTLKNRFFTPGYGAGVSLTSSGIFTMNGGTIQDNTASLSGGGVYIPNGATFTMNGGTIEGNTAQQGGGVFNNGTFIVERGIIRNNKAVGHSTNPTPEPSGGGIYTNGTFTVNDFIEISGNHAEKAGASGRGGGIFWIGGNIYINNCRIVNNYANSTGGGIFETTNSSSLSITIHAGIISGNIAVDDGGGLGGGWGGFPGPTINFSLNVIVTGNTLSNGTPSDGWPP